MFPETIDTPERAHDYVELVREMYRNEDAAYKGARSDEQKLIAEVTAIEAREIVDGVMLGMLALNVLGQTNPDGPKLPPDYETKVEKAGYTWKDYRSEFERLLVGFGVITNRLHRDHMDVPSYSDLPTNARMKVASSLFGDFLAHNALRFGVDTAGLKATRNKTAYTEDGGIEIIKTVIDKDEANSEKELNENIKRRGYRSDASQHPAAKLSPTDYIALRKSYPEIDKDKFDQDVGYYTDVKNALENQES